MITTENDIVLTKPELRALLDFAGKDPADPERYGVQFEAKGSRAFARATNTKRSVTCQGEAMPKGLQGSWFVERGTLVDCSKLAAASNQIRLRPTIGSSWLRAEIGPEEQEDETKVRQLNSPHGCVQQLSFPDVARETRVPKGAELVTRVALPAATMASLAIVGKAVGANAAIECYASDNEDAPSVFCTGNSATRWTVAIMPWRVEAKPQKRKATKQAELPLDAPPKPQKAVDPADLAAARRAKAKARVAAGKRKRGPDAAA